MGEHIGMDLFRQALAHGTIPRTAGSNFPAARFSLLLRAEQNPVVRLAEIRATLAAIRPDVEVRFLSPQEHQIMVVIFPDLSFGADDASTFETAHALAAQFDLEAAEPDIPTNFHPQPLGPLQTKGPVEEGFMSFPPGCFVPAEPGLDQKPRWALEAIGVPAAWWFSEQQRKPDRGAGILIAQPDTGITEHPDLAKVVESHPYNVLDNTADASDPLTENLFGNPGHGTGTASVVVSPEAAELSGVAPKATHMAIRAINSVVRITQGAVAEAVEWAVAHNAHVISMSLGGIPSFALHRAVRRAVGADIIVLAAAGNCVKLVVWPARYPDTIAVAGTDSADKPWQGSCRGPAVAISSPAQNVIRAQIQKGGVFSTGQGQGTSFATPLTAGAAALWLAHHGRANLVAAARARGEKLQEMFRRLVTATARRPADWDGFNMGAGIVDAHALLNADLDLGRERESAPLPDNEEERDRVAMESFVLEATGIPAAIQPGLNWTQFGPEIAAAILEKRLDRGLEAEAISGPPVSAVSAQLDEAVRSPELREAMGLAPK